MKNYVKTTREQYAVEKEDSNMTKTILQAMFDETISAFNPDDAISVEDANHVMHENWRKFIEAGAQVDTVVSMMSLTDIWENWDELAGYGATLDANAIADAMSEEKTLEKWDLLTKRGASPDILAEKCYGDLVITSVDLLEEIFAKGVSARKGFELVENWLSFRKDDPEEQIEILNCLLGHGLSKKSVAEWIEKNADSRMEDYAIESGSDFYKVVGANDDGMVDRWIQRNGWRYFNEESLADLPSTVSVSKLIASVPMKDILECVDVYNFESFIEDYLAAGQDINVLAKKFIDEIGYSSVPAESDALLDLVYAGASEDIIDTAKYLNLVDADKLDDITAKSWHDYFESEGFGGLLIAKLCR